MVVETGEALEEQNHTGFARFAAKAKPAAVFIANCYGKLAISEGKRNEIRWNGSWRSMPELVGH